MLRAVLALMIGAHGIGHILFLVSLVSGSDWGQSTRSWLITGETPARLIGSVLWGIALIAFCAAVYGLLDQQAWWRTAATLAAFVSTAGLIIFWVNPASSPAVSALVFNLVLLGALLIVHWPSVDTLGA